MSEAAGDVLSGVRCRCRPFDQSEQNRAACVSVRKSQMRAIPFCHFQVLLVLLGSAFLVLRSYNRKLQSAQGLLVGAMTAPSKAGTAGGTFETSSCDLIHSASGASNIALGHACLTILFGEESQ